MQKAVLTISAVLVFGTCTATAAAADSLTITPPSGATAGTRIDITVSGETSAYTATVGVFAVSGALTCPPKAEASLYYYPHTSTDISVSGEFPAVRPFSGTAYLFGVEHGGTYLLCGYLNYSATASAVMAVGPSATEVAEQAAARAKEAAEQAAAQAKQAAEKAAAEAAQAAARAKEESEHAPATRLVVRVSYEQGETFGPVTLPGHSVITISTSPYANVVFTADHGVGTRRWRQSASPKAVKRITVNWSCQHPSQTFHYRVKAYGGSGPPLSRSGHFKSLASAKWCRNARREREAFIKAVAEQERLGRERYVHNCRAIGGKPVTIETSEGRRLVCRSKTGGIIEVPT